jgi:hypothetical protein
LIRVYLPQVPVDRPPGSTCQPDRYRLWVVPVLVLCLAILEKSKVTFPKGCCSTQDPVGSHPGTTTDAIAKLQTSKLTTRDSRISPLLPLKDRPSTGRFLASSHEGGQRPKLKRSSSSSRRSIPWRGEGKPCCSTLLHRSEAKQIRCIEVPFCCSVPLLLKISVLP